MEPKYFDIHSHIQDERFNPDRGEVLKRMEEKGVWALVVGTYRKSSEDAVALAEKFPYLFATVGIHPTDVATELFDEQYYHELASNKKVVAIGECGFDYFHGGKTTEDKNRQKDMFERQLELAVSLQKPLMIHVRDAHDDMLSVLSSKKKEYGEKLRGNIHFFSGDKHTAKKYFDLDFTVSFTGVITFANDYNEVVRYAPLSHIMSETDCPYVAPVPHRGTRNEPVFVIEVVKRIAELRNEDFELVRQTLAQNSVRAFGIRV